MALIPFLMMLQNIYQLVKIMEAAIVSDCNSSTRIAHVTIGTVKFYTPIKKNKLSTEIQK